MKISDERAKTYGNVNRCFVSNDTYEMKSRYYTIPVEFYRRDNKGYMAYAHGVAKIRRKSAADKAARALINGCGGIDVIETGGKCAYCCFRDKLVQLSEYLCFDKNQLHECIQPQAYI